MREGFVHKFKAIKILLIMSLVFVLLLTTVSADTRVISNSGDWTEVYSAMLYANLKGEIGYFLTSPQHATIIPFAIPKDVDGVEVVTSRSTPYAAGYKSLLEIDGFRNVEEIRETNINIALGERLTVTKFVVIDPTYGYNAMSVAPLAALGDYYVLFANRRNIAQINNFLQDRTINELVLYGQLDREVKDSLSQFNPETINTGDRFDNNIAVVKKYQELHKRLNGDYRKQAILSNGEFIESSLMSGADPVLFIGFSNVPDQTREYISESPLEVGTLVGNELIGTATFIRRQTGLSVFVKFGQGSRTPTGAIAQVEDLDRFPIPRYNLDLGIVAISLNTATNKLEVTYQNKAPLATYFQAISLLLNDGTQTFNIPVEETPLFIDGNYFKTITYDLVDEDGNVLNPQGDKLSAQITTIYGESPKSLELTLIANATVSKVSVIDDTNIDIVDVAYQKSGSKFMISVKNTGDVTTYTSIELLDIYVNGEYLIFSSDEIVKIEPGKTKKITVTTTMTEEDIPENPEVIVRANYGQRENALTKSKQQTFEFKYASLDLTYLVAIGLIIILLLLIFLRKKCKNCGYRNVLGKKRCKKCKHRLD